MTTTKKTVYQIVTDRVIEAIESFGIVPWHKPWTGAAGCVSYRNGKLYSLLNHIMLDGRSGEYVTYNQIEEIAKTTGTDCHVKKGAHSYPIVFWKPIEEKDEETGDVKIRFILRYYRVFHIEDCEGLKPRWTKETQKYENKPHEAAEKVIRDYVDRSGVTLNIRNSAQAFYQPSTDSITIPEMAQYENAEMFYSTAFHEMTHSTGAEKRLNRITETAAFGSNTYSKEELVAEMGAAFLVNKTGLESEKSFANSAAYLKGWIEKLRKDSRLIVNAASAAEKAVKYILGTTAEEADQE